MLEPSELRRSGATKVSTVTSLPTLGKYAKDAGSKTQEGAEDTAYSFLILRVANW